MRYEIPLDRGAQTFSISLGGTTFQMRLVYRHAVGGGWYIDLVQEATGKGIYGLPLVVGADLLAQHRYLHFGHLYCELEGGLTRVPTYEDMGSILRLIWSSDDDDE